MRVFEASRRSAFLVLILAGLAAALAAPALVAQESSADAGVLAPPAALRAPESQPADAPLAQAWWRVVGSTLKPRQNDVSYATNGSGGCIYVTAGNASTVWNTPLWIPNGATVQYLRIYVNDTSASDLWGWFTIYDLFGAIVQEWGISSSGTPGETWFDTAAINHVIDYSTYSYVVNMRPVGTGSTLQFCGARVFFTPPTVIFIDGFETGNTSRWSAAVP